MLKFLFTILFILISFPVLAEENSLTIKQQIERLQREVSDLSEMIYTNKNNDRDLSEESTNNLSANISAFDMRVYDLETDIKNLNLSFEEIVFEIDELRNLIKDLNIKLDFVILSNDTKNKISEVEDAIESSDNENKEPNTLGTLKINSEDLSTNTEEIENKSINVVEEKNDENAIKNQLSPDEQFQLAFDLLRSQQFDKATNSLKDFILNNKEHELSGSAHYWLGEIHLLKKEYREAALVFAEGYQQYPNSVKSPDILYKLAESLSKINKVNEACSTYKKFLTEYPTHKLVDESVIQISVLKCESN